MLSTKEQSDVSFPLPFIYKPIKSCVCVEGGGVMCFVFCGVGGLEEAFCLIYSPGYMVQLKNLEISYINLSKF